MRSATGESTQLKEGNMSDTESILTSLDDDKSLILPQLKSPPMTGSFSSEDNFDETSTPKLKAT